MNADRALVLVLRVTGGAMVLAIVAVFMPFSWMASCHEKLGLGPMPTGAIVEYLARSVSAFYAIMGGLIWLLAGRARRYADVISYLAFIFVVFGVVILVIDIRLGLPLWWILLEGPPILVIGLVVLTLQARV